MFLSVRKPSIGIIGFGAFGRLMARHLAPHATLRAYDPAWPGGSMEESLVQRSSLGEAAACDVVILAVPVARLAAVATAMMPHLRRGALVLDVGSVKVGPVEALLRCLPPHVDILATHPLFGPQSAGAGVAGHKIVLCPVRGRRTALVARFLRRQLGLDIIVVTPDEHDRDLATVQGLTHMMGRLLMAMGPLPARLTTPSFDLLVEATVMVASDAPEVFDAILQANPHAAAVQTRFFAAAARLEAALAPPGEGIDAADVSLLTARSPHSAILPAWSSVPESAPSWCP